MQIEMEPELKKMTTLRLGGPCIAKISFKVPDDLEELAETLKRLGGQPIAIGGGSNILAAGGERDKVLLRVMGGGQPEDLGMNEEGRVIVRSGTGLWLTQLMTWCGKQGYAGLEGLAGVPGTVGGAVAGNSGSFGCEADDCLQELQVLSSKEGLINVPVSDTEWAYRHFSIPRLLTDPGDWYVITGVSFAFVPAFAMELEENMKDFMVRKRSMQPLGVYTAGCVFKNPDATVVNDDPDAEIYSAGKMLEMTGFKGKNIGGMSFSSMHANFLVNDGTGTPEQAMEIINQAKAAVKERFGVDLETEIRIWES